MDMIDEKKIEEAADKYVKETCTEDMSPVTKVTAEMSFHKGINWFLDNLWHDASEEPEKRNENIIVLQDEDDEDESNPLYAAIVHERHDTFPWDEYCEDNAIYKWCYFKDIAPKKGGEQ